MVINVRNSDALNDLVLQPDGKIVAVGGALDGNNNGDWVIVRYNADGSLDSTFGGTGIVLTDFGLDHDLLNGDDALAVSLQPDGKSVVAGLAQEGGNSTSRIAVARYDTIGNLDSSFGTGGKVKVGPVTDHREGDLLIQADGGIVLACSEKEEDGDFNAKLLRLNSDGSTDPMCGTDGIVSIPIKSYWDVRAYVARQWDSKLLVGSSGFNGTDNDFSVVRLLGCGEPALPSLGLWGRALLLFVLTGTAASGLRSRHHRG